MNQRFFFLLLFFLFSVALYSQQVLVTGRVRDQYNKPVSNVAVAVENTSNGVFTDVSGKYTLSVARGKAIRITFSLIGYQKQTFSIGNPIQNFVLDVIFQEEATALDSITVEGRKRNTNTFDGLNKNQTKFLPNASGGAVETLISTFAGVNKNDELSSQYSVRGGNYDENIVYVNGIEIYRPLLVRSSRQEGLSFINPYMIEAVNFSAGGYGVEYGDKMSSVLDIKYKKPSAFEGTVEGSLLGGGAYIGSTTGQFSQITSVRYKTTQSTLKTTDTKAEYDPSFFDFQNYMTYSLSSKWEIGFLGNYAQNKYRFTPQSRETRFGTLSNSKSYKVYFNGWEDDKFVNYHAALTLKGKISNDLELGLNVATFSSDEYERYDINGAYRLTELNVDENGNASEGELLGVGSYLEHARNKLDANIYNVSHSGSYKIAKNILKWGFTLQKEKVKDNISEWIMRDSTGYSIPYTGQTVNMYSNLRSNNKLDSERFSGYIQDNYKLNTDIGLLIFNAGVRASHWTYNKETIVSPRGSVAFIPANADRFTLRFASGIYYQAPFYKELQRTVNVGGNNIIEMNKDIKSQKSIHYVLGGDYYFKMDTRPFKLSTELYYKKLSDLIPYTVNNVKVRYVGENIAKGYAMGMDWKLYGEFVEGVDSWLSLSLMKTRQDIGGVNVPLPTDQSYNISLFFQDYMPGYDRLKMSLLGYFAQSLPFSAPNKGYESGYFRSPAYKRVDIGFSWQLLGEDFNIRNRSSFCRTFKNIWIGLDVFNLFDINNTNTYYWVTDVYNQQYAVPNYLTGRQLNVKIIADF